MGRGGKLGQAQVGLDQPAEVLGCRQRASSSGWREAVPGGICALLQRCYNAPRHAEA